MRDGVDPADRAVAELACEPAAKVDGALPSLAEEHGEALRIEIAAQRVQTASERQNVARHSRKSPLVLEVEEVSEPAVGAASGNSRIVHARLGPRARLAVDQL